MHHWLWTGNPNLQRKYPLECNQMTKREREKGDRKRKKKRNLAANEVLSEIHNVVCTALKDLSRVGVFLYGPQQKCGQGGRVVGERGSWLWGLPCWDNCANNNSLTSWTALCTRVKSWKICVSVSTFWACCLCKFKDDGLSSPAERTLVVFIIII